MFTWQLDVKTAFLNARLEEVIYCQPVYDQVPIMQTLLEQTRNPVLRTRIATQIHDIGLGAVLRLHRAVYGLKQAPRAWWMELHGFLTSLGFERNPYDACFYVMHTVTGLFILLLIYVDDILIAARTEGLTMHYARALEARFKIGSAGPLRHYLNIAITLLQSLYKTHLCMAHYVDQVSKRFRMVPKPAILTPMQENPHLTSAEEEEWSAADAEYFITFEYREKIGCILYYMVCMRPDLAYCVGIFGKFSNKPTRLACAAVTRVLQYMHNTRNMVLILGRESARITAYFDSDFAACLDTRCSIGAYFVFLGFGCVE